MADHILKGRINSDAILELENKSSQLASLLLLVHGVGFDSFNSLAGADRDNVLWLASDLAHKIKELVNGE